LSKRDQGPPIYGCPLYPGCFVPPFAQLPCVRWTRGKGRWSKDHSFALPPSLSLFHHAVELATSRAATGQTSPREKEKKKHNKGFDLFLCGFFSFLREVVFPGTCEQEGLAQGIVAQAPNGEVFQISSRSSFFWDDGRGWHGGGGGGRQRLRVFFSSLLETKLGPDHRAFFFIFWWWPHSLVFLLCGSHTHTKKKGRPHSTGSLPLFPKKRGLRGPDEGG